MENKLIFGDDLAAVPQRETRARAKAGVSERGGELSRENRDLSAITRQVAGLKRAFTTNSHSKAQFESSRALEREGSHTQHELYQINNKIRRELAHVAGERKVEKINNQLRNLAGDVASSRSVSAAQDALGAFRAARASP